MKPNLKRRELSFSLYDMDGMTLAELSAFLMGKWQEVPKSYREAAKADIEAGDEYSSGRFCINWWSPLTAEERKAAAEHAERVAESVKAREMELLEHLAKKYGAELS